MNKKSGLFGFCCLILLIIAGEKNNYAQEGDAGQPGEFLRYGVGARALGLGRAFTAMANDASAVYWNPAGLIGVQRKEFTSQYSNLFYDSRFTYIALAMPRTYAGSEYHAWGIAWVNLNMANFDYRDKNNINEEKRSFDINEQAIIFSGAREWVGSWGIINYGVNFKLIGQSLPTTSGFTSEDWDWGMDFGVTFQPINLPILRSIPKIGELRFLLPLQVGFVVQNFFRPNVGINNTEKDKFPRIFRGGVNYRVNCLNILYDLENYSGRGFGHYGGIELKLPYTEMLPKIRFGFNNRTDKFTFGGGLRFDISKNISTRLDYAWNRNNSFGTDSRFFLTLEFGHNYNSDYFFTKSNINQRFKHKRTDHLQVLTHYPVENYLASADSLGAVYDTTNAERYLKLIGGIKLANIYFEKAKEKLKQNNSKGAQKDAKKANSRYKHVFENSLMNFSETDMLNFAESLIITEKYRMAIDTVMAEIDSQSLRYLYLTAICYKNLGNWNRTIEFFRRAIQIEVPDENNMKVLSLFGLGQSLMQTSKYNAVIDTLNIIVRNYFNNLNSNYPRYPSYLDTKKDNINNIADNAQFLIGYCFAELKDYEKSFISIFKLNRFYPQLNTTKLFVTFSNQLYEQYLAKDYLEYFEILKKMKKEIGKSY